MRRLLHLLALAGCAGGLDLRPFVVIAEPAADAVVYGAAEAPAPDARNLRTVRIVLHYYDLPPDPSALGLWIRFDRGEATVMGPPLPSSALEVSLRLGTHLVDGSGGLRVYGASVPDHVPFPEANRDFRAVRRHVAGAAFVDVDHRSNRCVVFRSKLVHETRPFYFRRDYGAYRINLTFMYGTSDWSSAWRGKRGNDGDDDDPRMYDAPG